MNKKQLIFKGIVLVHSALEADKANDLIETLSFSEIADHIQDHAIKSQLIDIQTQIDSICEMFQSLSHSYHPRSFGVSLDQCYSVDDDSSYETVFKTVFNATGAIDSDLITDEIISGFNRDSFVRNYYFWFD